jgi:hypothetical protein
VASARRRYLWQTGHSSGGLVWTIQLAWEWTRRQTTGNQ